MEGEALGPPMKIQVLKKARRRQEGLIIEEENNRNQSGDNGKEKEESHGNLMDKEEKKEEGEERPQMENELGRDPEEQESSAEPFHVGPWAHIQTALMWENVTQFVR